MRRRFLLLVSLASFAGRSHAAARGQDVVYVNGTFSVPAETTGRLDLSGPAKLVFLSKLGTFEIAYSEIKALEYGQKISRRIIEAIAISPVFLLTKRRRHFFTVLLAGPEGKMQGGVVFEVGKDRVYEVAILVENRSKLKLEFESKEAERQFRSLDYRPLINRAPKF
jgi:hypothetical protein